MIVETRFDPTADLLVVGAYAGGPRGSVALRLAIDTGAAATVIVPEVIDALGYRSRDGYAVTTVTSAIGREQGYLLRLAWFEALGFREVDFAVHVFDLASHHGIDGLIGLNFLEHFNYEVRSQEGRILVGRATPVLASRT